MVFKKIVGMLGMGKKKNPQENIARTLITKPKKSKDLGSLLTGVPDNGNSDLNREILSEEQIEELEIFDGVYNFIRQKFPYVCEKCKRTYQNESEYIASTQEIPGVTDRTNSGSGYSFDRNCVCGTKITLNINPKFWDSISQGRFKRYFGEKTTRMIRKLETEAIVSQLPLRNYTLPTLARVQKITSKIDHDWVKMQVHQNFRARYNAYVLDRENSK